MEEIRSEVAGTAPPPPAGKPNATAALDKALQGAIDKAIPIAEPKAKPAKEADVTPKARDAKATPQPDALTAPKDAPKVDAPKERPKEQEVSKQAAAAEAEEPFATKQWTDEERAAFAKAPPEVQTAVNKLVKNLHNGFNARMRKLADTQKFAEEITSSFSPQHRAEMQEHGVNESGVLKQFLQLHDAYRKDPVGYVRYIMQASGVTPAHLGFNQANGAAQPQQNGATQGLPPDLQNLVDEWNQFKHGWSQNLESQQQGQINNISSQIVAFRDEIGTDGLPLHPHFDDLQPEITALLQSNRQIMSIPNPVERLKAAYESALRANPQTWEEVHKTDLERQKQAWEAERTRAALSIKPRAGSTGVRQSGRSRSLDEIIRTNAAKYGE